MAKTKKVQAEEKASDVAGPVVDGEPAAPTARKRASNRKSIEGVRISPDTRVRLYGLAAALPKEFKEDAGLLLPFATYFQDPFVDSQDPPQTVEDEIKVAWEPGLTDGPTSSRFAVVDFNADNGKLEAPAVWDDQQQAFVDSAGGKLDKKSAAAWQFHQVNVWALLQAALTFFESGSALGRRIPWAFEGNRLIVVPHAGYGENAYYDRASKSLQFYFFEAETGTVYTCLSADIVHHELGHAVLDGIRPLFTESVDPQTGAFHEFMGDLCAILLTLNNGELRQRLAEASEGRFDKATDLAALAAEFGLAVQGRPYLRTALNTSRMSDLQGETSPHRLSGVLTGAMFDVLIRIGDLYATADEEEPGKKPTSAKQRFWWAADRMQRTAIQPIDLLPPVEATFRDYALAVCRAQQLADPLDPEGYYDLLIQVFREREILSEEDEKVLKSPRYLHERLELSVRHNIDDISRSRAAAYRFLDDNREDLLIPKSRDFFIADLYDANKRGRQNLPLPRQIVLQYAWREEVSLEGKRFGSFAGRTTLMLCGGTLVFSDNGTVLSWMHKSGSEPYGGRRQRRGKIADKWAKAVQEGQERKQRLLDFLEKNVAAGRVGRLLPSTLGLMPESSPPMVARDDGDVVQFQLSRHLHLAGTEDEDNAADAGERQWEISC